jgi:hypothetical protein
MKRHPFLAKKRRPRRVGFYVVLLLALTVGYLGFAYRAPLSAFAREAWLVVNKPDIRETLKETRRKQFGMICKSADDCWIFDSEGIIYAAARTVVGDVLVRIEDESDFAPEIQARVVRDSDWANLMPIIEFAQTRAVDVSRFVLRRAEGEVRLTTPDGVLMRFSLDVNPREHIAAFPSFIRRAPLATLEYADFRIPGKIFYKER